MFHRWVVKKFHDSWFFNLEVQSTTTTTSEGLAAIDEKSCQLWPKTSKLPIECCEVPEVFKPEIKEKCFANCTQPNDPKFNSWCCISTCLFDESGMTAEGNFSRENAKKELSKALEKYERVVKALEEIIFYCAKTGKLIGPPLKTKKKILEFRLESSLK